MTTDWNTALAAAERAAEQRQAVEDEAHRRFDEARSALEQDGRAAHVTETPEFSAWMAARRACDEAWGAWATLMDAKLAAC